jgi:spore germination cell wall hydrolase CwlJ-like protein
VRQKVKPEQKRIFNLLADWQLMGLCIEREASGEPREGQIAVATVILERVDHRKWDGNTIREVILLPWQFSWTMPEAGETYYDEAVYIASNWVEAYGDDEKLRQCCAIATGMLQGTIPRDPDLAAVHCCQYLNPSLAPETRKEWIKSGMKSIKTIKRHEFFA